MADRGGHPAFAACGALFRLQRPSCDRLTFPCFCILPITLFSEFSESPPAERAVFNSRQRFGPVVSAATTSSARLLVLLLPPRAAFLGFGSTRSSPEYSAWTISCSPVGCDAGQTFSSGS